MVGTSISHYEVLEELGRGGMGILYRARDTRLDRLVAIKVLHAEAVSSADRRERFIREAKAASALNHPHIVTVYEVDRASSNGVEHDFIVMEHIDGASLDKRLASGPLAMAEAVELATQTAEGLAAAHEAGIIHRDVKPANIMITPRGQVKLVDFGLAKLTEVGAVDSDVMTRSGSPATEHGAILGTAAYMSPEQAEGRPVDRRTDIFSFGVVLYEMLTGRRAFEEDTQVTTRVAILSRTPPAVRSIRPDVPAALERVASRCLQKDRDARYPSAVELAEDLRRVRADATRQPAAWRRPRVLVPALLTLAVVVGAGAWAALKASRVRWARDVALPEIRRLTDRQESVAAYDLAQQARRYLPDDRELERLVNVMTLALTLRTDPPAADVSWKPYGRPDAPWRPLGRTPIEGLSFPTGYFRWRFEKAGYDTVEWTGSTQRKLDVPLHPAGSSPTGMVWVPARPSEVRGGRVAGRIEDDVPLQVPGFWLDRLEVTNKQFKAFADFGGYRKPELWKHPFVRAERRLSWTEAMKEMVDKTGQPGPAVWELGAYPAGEDDYPVRGVSWFEAAAFAESTGKELPTVHHWLAATDSGSPAEVGELSNFGGRGPERVGTRQGFGPFGTLDMAGNVKEWCFNAAGPRRYTVGGAWSEPSYMYRSPHAQSPFERLETQGFRTAKYVEPAAERLTAAIERTWRDYSRSQPVDDATFRLYASFYGYDPTPLEPTVEAIDSGSPYWRKEKVGFAAAYGGERVIGYLFLPTNARPPYQTVVYFPGSGAQTRPSHEDLQHQFLDFMIRSGRAVLLPIYKGTYERRLRELPPDGSRAARDLDIQMYQDLARSVDYLMTRTDIDKARLAYFGFSLGARLGVIYTALEKRFKTSMLVAGGLDYDTPLPEHDPVNFAHRVTVPTLMLSGRDDFRFPLEESQKPLFRTLGTPAEHKRHLLIRGGHVPPRLEIIKGVLDWLDRYLGPVETRG